MKGSLLSFMDRTVCFLPEGRSDHHDDHGLHHHDHHHHHLPMVIQGGCYLSSSTHYTIRFLILFFLLLLLLTSSTCHSQDVSQHRQNHHHHQQRHLLQQPHHHNHQEQRTDYADASSASAAFMINNQTSSRISGVDNLSGISKYPLPLKDTVKPQKNKRKRGHTEVPHEEEYGGVGGGGRGSDDDGGGGLGGSFRPSMSPIASAASRALFLQAASKESRDQMLKSSKDALIVTKKSYLKKDWCKTEPLIQRVREAGCFTRTVVNRFCYGQCNSFYIPKNAKRDIEDTSFKSCSFCKPKRFRWITITLHCPGRNPPYKKKRIQRIKKCKCISEILQ